MYMAVHILKLPDKIECIDLFYALDCDCTGLLPKEVLVEAYATHLRDNKK
jgi:hypothetical protein